MEERGKDGGRLVNNDIINNIYLLLYMKLFLNGLANMFLLYTSNNV